MFNIGKLASVNLGDMAVHLTLESDSFIKGLSAAESRLNAAADKFVSAGKKMTIGITAPLLAVAGVFTKAAMVQEDAVWNLSVALANSGNYTKEIIKDFEAYARAVQSSTIYGDELVLSTMDYGHRLGVTTDRLKEATTAAAGLAAKYNIDLQTAMMLVGRASQGQTQMLTRYGIILDDSLSTQEKFNELLRIGADAFSLAEGAAMTTSGALRRLKNNLGDMAEGFGDILLPAIRRFSDYVSRVTLTITGLSTEAKLLIMRIGLIAASIGPAILAIGLLTKAVAVLAGTLAAIISPIGLIVAAIVAAVAIMVAQIYALRAAWLQNWQGIRDIFQAAVESIRGGLEYLANTAFVKFFNIIYKNTTTGFKIIRENFTKFISDLVANASAAQAFLTNIHKGFKTASQEWAKAHVESYNNMQAMLSDFKELPQDILEITKYTLSEVKALDEQGFLSLWESVKSQFNDDWTAFLSFLKGKVSPEIQEVFDQFAHSFKGKTEMAVTVAENPQVRQMLNALDIEYQLLGKINDERERAVELAKFQAIAAEAYGKDSVEYLKAIVEYEEKLDRLMTGRRGMSAFTVQMKQWANDASNVWARVGEAATNALDRMSDALTNFVETGKMDMKAFARSVISDLLRIQIRAMMSAAVTSSIGQFGGVGIGGLFAGLRGLFGGGTPIEDPQVFGSSYGAVVAHGGGVVGSTNFPTRNVPAAMFNNAPRLHNGLMADEFPAILQKGERVFPSDSKFSPPAVTVNINNQTGQRMNATESDVRFDGKQFVIDVVVENINKGGILNDLVGSR